jgi:hypothetical protein
MPLLPLRPPGCYLIPFPVVVPRHQACLMLCTWSVMTRSPFLVCMSQPHGDLLLMLQPPHLQRVMVKFTSGISHSVLLWFLLIEMILLQRFLCFLVPPPLPVPLFDLALPPGLWAWLDAFLGVVNMDLLLLLLLLLKGCEDSSDGVFCCVQTDSLLHKTRAPPSRLWSKSVE